MIRGASPAPKKPPTGRIPIRTALIVVFAASGPHTYVFLYLTISMVLVLKLESSGKV